MDEAYSYPDLEKICRLCLTTEKPLVPIFPDAASNGGNQHYKLSIPMRIMACASLEVQSSDELPKSVCTECRLQLEQAYFFRKRSQSADFKLRKHIRLLNLGKKSNVFNKLDEDEIDDETEFRDSIEFIREYNERDKQRRKDARREKLLSYQKRFKERLRIEIEQELRKTLRSECLAQAKSDVYGEVKEKCRQQELRTLLSEMRIFLLEKSKNKKLCIDSYAAKDRNTSPTPACVSATAESPPVPGSSGLDSDSMELLYEVYSDVDAKCMKTYDSTQQLTNENSDQKVGKQDDIGVYIVRDKSIPSESNDDIDQMETEFDDENSTVQDSTTMEADLEPTASLPTDTISYRINDSTDVQFDGKEQYLNLINSINDNVMVINIENELNEEMEFVSLDKQEVQESLRTEASGVSELHRNQNPVQNTKRQHVHHNDTKNTEISVTTTSVEVLDLPIQRTSDILRMFKCSLCPMSMSTPNSLERHMKTHAKLKEKGVAYHCPHCKICLSCKSALKRHMLIHTGSRPYTCDDCGKSFVQREILKRHKLTHSGERPYKCYHCDRSFSQKSNLVQHINSNHIEEPKILQHKCHLCPKRFNHHSGLSRHLGTHSGITFKCTSCERSFNDRSSVKRHVAHVHGGD